MKGNYSNNFQQILLEAKKEKGVKVIIVDNSNVYRNADVFFKDWHIFDEHPATIQMELSERLKNTDAIIVTHSPFPCRYADHLFLHIPKHQHFQQFGKVDADSILFSRLKYGNILDAYGVEVF